MIFNLIKHNPIIFICILLIINGCEKGNSKLIAENNNIIQTTKKINNKPLAERNYKKKEVLKEKLTLNNKEILKDEENKNVIFEFKNERLLQGRNINNDDIDES